MLRNFLLPLAIVALAFGGCSGGGSKNSGGMMPPVNGGSRSTKSISQLHTYTATAPPGNSVKVTLSTSPAAGDTEVAIVYGYNTANTCYTLNVPTGWTQYDNLCANSRNQVWTLTHTAGSGETSYTFSLNTTNTNEYFSVVVYDLSGVGSNPIDGHADLAFTSGTQQKTSSLTPTQNGDLAIVTFANAYVKDPTIVTPPAWTTDGNVDGGIYLTSAHLALSSTSATQATANYSTAPSTGESNILLIAPAVPTIIENQPLLRIVSEGTIPSGTGLLYYGQVAAKTADCTGRSFGAVGCQSYPNYSIEQDYCDYNGGSTLAVHANSVPDEADFLHTATPISSSNRLSGSSSDGRCSWAANTYFLMNFAASDSASWLSSNVLNSASIASGGVFFDGNGLWYNGNGLGSMVEFGSSGTSCSPYPSCDHQYVSGGIDSTSYDAALGNTINKAQSTFHILLNNLAPAQTTGACYALTTTTPYHCVGGHYNYGTYDSRVKLDELCNAITSNTDLDLIRAENSQNAGPQNPPTVNPALGEEDAVILNTIYDLQYKQQSYGCKYTGILLEENYAFLAHWEEDDITAMQWMAPSSDGTPDEFAQQPYTYCLYNACSGKDYGLYPDAMIVPSGPQFTTSAYNIGTYTSPHDATDCPASGSPVSVQGDSGGATSMVVYCQSAAYPVFSAAYNHCYFVQYDLGACIAIFNTGTSAVTLSNITKLNLTPYHYQVSYGGYEFGSASSMGGSSSVAGMFPWLSTSSSLYSALSAEDTACNVSSYCNGSVSFQAVPTTVGANSAIFLVANKPSNY